MSRHRYHDSIRRKLSSFGMRAGIAFAFTLLLLFLSWIGDRISSSSGYDFSVMKQLKLSSILLNPDSDESWQKDYLLVNVAYDRQLADASDQFGIPAGKSDIADRDALIKFLKMLRGSKYRAVILDINFPRNINADSDSALAEVINRTPSILMPHIENENLAARIPSQKTAVSNYNVNLISGDFIKYPFLSNESDSSMALKALRLIGEDLPPRFAPLRQPAIVLPINYEIKEPYLDNGEKTWYNLGMDILDVYDPENIASLADGKIVVVGDFCDRDIHSTYAGEISGPVIIINAIETLRRRGDFVNPWSALMAAMAYFLISLAIIFNYPQSKFDIVAKRRLWIRMLLSILGFGVALGGLWMAQYFLFGELHDTQLVALALTVFAYFCQKFYFSNSSE